MPRQARSCGPSRTATDGSKGESGTAAPMVVKDKVLIGISGGRVRRARLDQRPTISRTVAGVERLFHRTGFRDADGSGKDHPARQAGRCRFRHRSTWEGEQWKTGGGTTWGWYSYDPKLNLVYYGTGNPSTWNPIQRPGDNRWSMTIFARDADTGMAKWVYQMTPHDEWDYDGVNEMILVDGMQVDGAAHDVLVHFDRNGFAYTLDRDKR